MYLTSFGERGRLIRCYSGRQVMRNAGSRRRIYSILYGNILLTLSSLYSACNNVPTFQNDTNSNKTNSRFGRRTSCSIVRSIGIRRCECFLVVGEWNRIELTCRCLLLQDKFELRARTRDDNLSRYPAPSQEKSEE